MSQNTLQLHLNTDADLIAREVPSQRVLEISVQAPLAANQSSRSQLNLALVLDRSGSMSGEKLDFVKLAARHVLDLLEEQDHVALVAYDDEINLLSPSTPVTKDNRIELKRRISNIEPGGSTNLSDGWLAGCQEVASAAQEGTLNRAMLLTDGLANAGITDLEELAQHARELSRRGISTSTFGVGQGFNEHLLEAMSNQAGGNFYYIATPNEIPDLFLREFRELVAVTARDVEIIVEAPPHVNIQVLGGWRVDFSEGRLRIFLGNLFSGQTQELFIKLLNPPLGELNELVFTVKIFGKGETGQLYEDRAEFAFQYADQDKVEAAPRKRDVLERFARVDLAEAANEALKLERLGENDKASRLLTQSIEDNRPYIESSQADEYQRMSQIMKHGMDEADRKQSHYNTYTQKRQRGK